MEFSPVIDVCNRLMDEADTPMRVRAHCFKVADFALRIAGVLSECGEPINLELVFFSALLHDVKRSSPNHAAAGAVFVREKGYPEAAEIISRHMDIGEVSNSGVSECEIVYLADKVTLDDGFCSLCDRLSSLTQEKRPYAEPRIRAAMLIQRKIEDITLRPFSVIMGVTVS